MSPVDYACPGSFSSIWLAYFDMRAQEFASSDSSYSATLTAILLGLLICGNLAFPKRLKQVRQCVVVQLIHQRDQPT